MNRADIKTAIDIVDQIDDEQAAYVARCLMESGDEIAKLRSRVSDLVSAIESMRVAGGSAEFQAMFDRAKALIG